MCHCFCLILHIFFEVGVNLSLLKKKSLRKAVLGPTTEKSGCR